ncbi:hypothetical protein R0J93_22035, partial [Pseudoalteromonas sp. SIMBA_148]
MTNTTNTNCDIDNQMLIDNWQQVKTQMTQVYEQAAERADRSTHHTTLLAVSKTKPANMVSALAKQGQRDFGENYLQ